MLGTRILLVFSEFSNQDALVDTLLDALARAARPFALRFALPAQFAAAIQELPPELSGEIGAKASILFYEEALGLEGVLPLLSDETHFLSLKARHFFAEKWDQGFLTRLRKLPTHSPALLTLMASAEEEGMGVQAFLPALTETFTENAVKLGRGLPFVCGASPMRTLIANPTVIFGKTEYLHQAETSSAYLSIGAFVAGCQLFAVETPLLWPMLRPGKRWLEKPHEDKLPKTHLARFEQTARFSFEKRCTGARATLGLFTTEDRYPQQIPLRTLVSQRTKTALSRVTRPMPMLVTAFCDLPEALRPTPLYMIRFSYLKALASLPLVLFAGGSQERTLRMNFPNTLSYPDNSLLPKAYLQEGMTAMQHFKRNKLLLLQRTRAAYPEFSHYMWVDFDILEYPVPIQAMPDFSSMADDTIHMATVNGEPDGSMIIVPRQHIKLLSREILALCQLDAAIKRSFSETAMLRRILDKFPDLFTLHPMPERRLLFESGFAPELLSSRRRALLAEAAPPCRGTLPASGKTEVSP